MSRPFPPQGRTRHRREVEVDDPEMSLVLLRRGARIVTGLADHPWGLRDFVIEMPGGHRLALGEQITQSR